MKFSVSSRTHDIIVAKPPVPPEHAHELNPGSEVYIVEGTFGEVVSHEISAGGFSLLHDFYCIREKCSLQFKGGAPALQVLICLKGRLHFVITGIGDLHLQQGQFIILYVPGVEVSTLFEQPAELLTFNIYVPVETLQPFLVLFPIQAFMDEIAIGRPALLFQRPGWITHEILRNITYLLAFQYNEAMRAYFFELKIKELLLRLFQQKFYSGETPINETALEAVRWARHIMESHMGAIPSLEEMAVLVDADIHRLKEDFKSVVGVSMAVFLMQARMNNAKLLIQETDLPISEIASISGYSRPEDFSQAFKKHFDYSPLLLRKDKK